MTRFYTDDRIKAMYDWVQVGNGKGCDDCKILLAEICLRAIKKRNMDKDVSQEEIDAYDELATIAVWHTATH